MAMTNNAELASMSKTIRRMRELSTLMDKIDQSTQKVVALLEIIAANTSNGKTVAEIEAEVATMIEE